MISTNQGSYNFVFSFVVAVYNTAKFLPECIDSILAQTFVDFEIVIIDDGSTDGSSEICDEYACKDSRVRVIHSHNNCGIVYSRRTGVDSAKGKYICFVDSDDTVSPDLLETVVRKFTSLPDMVLYDSVKEFRNGRSIIMRNEIEGKCYDRESIEKEILDKLFVNNNLLGVRTIMPNVWGKIIRRELLAMAYSHYDDTIRVGDDLGACVSCFIMAESVGVMHGKQFYHYRVNSESVMHKYNPLQFEKTKILCDWLENLVAEEGHRELIAGVNKERAFFAISSYYNEFFFKSGRSRKQKSEVVKIIVNDESVVKAIESIPASEIAFPNRLIAALIKKKKCKTLFLIGYSISFFRPFITLFVG